MKSLLSLLFSLLLSCVSLFAQDGEYNFTPLYDLDEKNGFREIRLGSFIQHYKDFAPIENSDSAFIKYPNALRRVTHVKKEFKEEERLLGPYRIKDILLSCTPDNRIYLITVICEYHKELFHVVRKGYGEADYCNSELPYEKNGESWESCSWRGRFVRLVFKSFKAVDLPEKEENFRDIDKEEIKISKEYVMEDYMALHFADIQLENHVDSLLIINKERRIRSGARGM